MSDNVLQILGRMFAHFTLEDITSEQPCNAVGTLRQPLSPSSSFTGWLSPTREPTRSHEDASQVHYDSAAYFHYWLLLCRPQNPKADTMLTAIIKSCLKSPNKSALKHWPWWTFGDLQGCLGLHKVEPGTYLLSRLQLQIKSPRWISPISVCVDSTWVCLGLFDRMV